MLLESKQRCSALKGEVLSANGEIFGKSKKALLFREYMVYHMLICMTENCKNYIEALPIELRGAIIRYKRTNPFGIYRLIAHVSFGLKIPLDESPHLRYNKQTQYLRTKRGGKEFIRL